jgi:hypothetical protein
LVKRQFSAKIQKLKTDNGGKYVHKEKTVFLEIQGIIYDLSLPYAYKSNCLPECMNCAIVIMIRSMSLDRANVIPQALWAEVCSMAVYIKNRLLHSIFKLENHHTK